MYICSYQVYVRMCPVLLAIVVVETLLLLLLMLCQGLLRKILKRTTNISLSHNNYSR